MNIAIIGLGFVGATTAVGLAEVGHKVYGVEKSRERLEKLSRGELPFLEPGLDVALHKHIGKNIFFSSTLKDIPKVDAVFFAVGTPSDSSGKVDLTHLESALSEVIDWLEVENNTKAILIIKSTVPPGTLRDDIKPMFVSRKTVPEMASNPEFLREGFAWNDFMFPDRIIIGVESERAEKVLKEIYDPFKVPHVIVDTQTAEFIKYLSNTMLSTMISFSNEMSMIAFHVGGIDIRKSFQVLHKDKRWSGSPAGMSSYVYPGIGFGGYCLPKDTIALSRKAKDHGFGTAILNAVIETNQKVKSHIVDQVRTNITKDRKIGIMGLSFKAGSDDVRETVSKEIIQALLADGYTKITAYDPVSNKSFHELHNLDIQYSETLEELAAHADDFLLLTSWPEFKEKESLFDGKKILDFKYFL